MLILKNVTSGKKQMQHGGQKDDTSVCTVVCLLLVLFLDSQILEVGSGQHGKGS